MFRILAILTCCAALAAAQATQPPDRARYEVLVVNGPGSLRLDRDLGKVSRLVTPRDQPARWQEMSVPGLPAIGNAGSARFQLLSGPALPLLLDTSTGRTWQLVFNAANSGYTWNQVQEPTAP